LRYVTDKPVPNAELELQYYSADGKTRIASPRTGERGEGIRLEPPGGIVEFTCECLPLTPGCYYVAASVHDLATSQPLAWWDGETRLYVDRGPATRGQFYFPHSWRVTHTAASATLERCALGRADV